MTYKEKLKMDCPGDVDEFYNGGCYGCPHTHGYCEKSETLCADVECGVHSCNSKCTKCWNQTIPDTKEKKTKRLPPEKKEWRATYAYFKDGHKEKVCYSTSFSELFFHFATESGVYAWNDVHYTLHGGAPIKGGFSECRTYRDERGVLRTMYLDASKIDHVDFEEVEVNVPR